MNIVHRANYEEMSKQGAEEIITLIKQKKDARICLATGASVKRMYEILVNSINEQRIDISNITFVKLDEWYGIDPNATFSCAYFLRNYVFDQLYMQPKQVIEFQTNAPNIEEELNKVEDYLAKNPLDLMILGLGMNGHLGLNEPASSLPYSCHLADLSEKTKTHDMAKGNALTQGFTIGMKGIFEAHKVLMLVCGTKKEEAYQAFMSACITTYVPASLLWLHHNCVSVIDDEQFL